MLTTRTLRWQRENPFPSYPRRHFVCFWTCCRLFFLIFPFFLFVECRGAKGNFSSVKNMLQMISLILMNCAMKKFSFAFFARNVKRAAKVYRWTFFRELEAAENLRLLPSSHPTIYRNFSWQINLRVSRGCRWASNLTNVPKRDILQLLNFFSFFSGTPTQRRRRRLRFIDSSLHPSTHPHSSSPDSSLGKAVNENFKSKRDLRVQWKDFYLSGWVVSRLTASDGSFAHIQQKRAIKRARRT